MTPRLSEPDDLQRLRQLHFKALEIAAAIRSHSLALHDNQQEMAVLLAAFREREEPPPPREPLRPAIRIVRIGEVTTGVQAKWCSDENSRSSGRAGYGAFASRRTTRASRPREPPRSPACHPRQCGGRST